MHRFQPMWPEDLKGFEPPDVTDFLYRDARDVVEYSSQDNLTTWRTWPEVWHLDATGRWCCSSRGTSIDSVREFAESPADMLDCRLESTGDLCPDHWVIIESRRSWWPERYDVTEGDALAFVTLRASLAWLGVDLLDVVIFRDDLRWWSLHELTCGTTAWRFAPPSW